MKMSFIYTILACSRRSVCLGAAQETALEKLEKVRRVEASCRRAFFAPRFSHSFPAK